MTEPLLQTKLFPPPLRPSRVPRPRLLEQLTAGWEQGRWLFLLSAPAGFGKSTLLSEWVSSGERAVAWLSLDEADNDPARFLAYLAAALQSMLPAAPARDGLPEPDVTNAASLLVPLLNAFAAAPGHYLLVLDDFHLIEDPVAQGAVAFLLDHLPPALRLAIATREEPPLPLARLRARGQLGELRAADLRFTEAEAAAFLNDVMGLDLTAAAVAALEARTEGWIAGLQLAALSLQRRADTAAFIDAFSGSHQFVLDYLLDEVLGQQPEAVQTFLLHTSILDRLCGPLCDAMLLDPHTSGQEMLENLERANLFIVPLDDERRWYRYHHLFADLLRRARAQAVAADQELRPETLHCRASAWYEENGFALEAFTHAAAAGDIDRAAQLLEGEGMPLHFRGATGPVLRWLESLPPAELDTRPALWVTYAWTLTMNGQAISNVEEKLAAAEAALQAVPADETSRDLLGHIAVIRAMQAIPHYQYDEILLQSRRALELLHPDNLPARTAASWTLGLSHQRFGERQQAKAAFQDAIAASRASGNIMFALASHTSLAQIEESELHAALAAANYRRVLELAGDPPYPGATESYLGLARLFYARNELEAAAREARTALPLGRQMETVDTPARCQALLARVLLANGDVENAAALLAEAEQFMCQGDFTGQMQSITAGQVRALLAQGRLEMAGDLAAAHDLPRSRARVLLARDEAPAALALLEETWRELDQSGTPEERLRLLVLLAIAREAGGQREKALQSIEAALALAEPAGYLRLFLDEGPAAVPLLQAAAARGTSPVFARRVLDAFPAAQGAPSAVDAANAALVEPLSGRELEILGLIAEGLSNREIGQRLFLALNTVKGHNRHIFAKLGVKRRTEAVARAQELGLLNNGH
ncbi:MAG: LuxR C-terminal-related transcriptional regulator [Candidatus Promineifilaceae bacterium]